MARQKQSRQNRSSRTAMAKQPNKNLAPLTDRLAIVSIRDRFSTYPSKGLTPEKLSSLLREADGGDVYRQMELFEEMLEKDAHLQSLFQARRLAVIRRNYSIIPSSDDANAVELADKVDRMIKRIRSWRNVLADILDCVPKGFSVNELYWTIRNGQYEIDGARHWHQKKFRFGKISDIESDPEQLRLVLDPRQVDKFRGLVPESELSLATTDGIDLESDPQFRKRFVVAFCKARSGNPARTSLLRTCTYLFLFKNYDIKWWIQFAEILLGYRVGKYDAAQTDQKEILEKALAGLATDSAAVISKDAEIEFVEMAQKAASHKTYTDIKDWCNEEMSEVVLGHTGTTSGTPGKLGQEDMAKEVKQELVEADAAVMDETISDQIIRNYIEINFGQQEEYPYYQTDLSPALNLSEEADLDIKIQEMGGDIPAEYVKEKYGRPLLNKDGEALIPRSKQATLLPAKAVLAASKKKLLRQR